MYARKKTRTIYLLIYVSRIKDDVSFFFFHFCPLYSVHCDWMGRHLPTQIVHSDYNFERVSEPLRVSATTRPMISSARAYTVSCKGKALIKTNSFFTLLVQFSTQFRFHWALPPFASFWKKEYAWSLQSFCFFKFVIQNIHTQRATMRVLKKPSTACLPNYLDRDELPS